MLEQREVRASGRSIGNEPGHLSSSSSPWADNACLACLLTICKYLRASSGLLGRVTGRGAGRRESFITVRRWAAPSRADSSLLLLPQSLRSRRTCASQMIIHHRGSGTRRTAPPHVRLEPGTRGLPGSLLSDPANAHPE